MTLHFVLIEACTDSHYMFVEAAGIASMFLAGIFKGSVFRCLVIEIETIHRFAHVLVNEILISIGLSKTSLGLFIFFASLSGRRRSLQRDLEKNYQANNEYFH